jgi:Cu/Ag efflux protein CusF
MNKAKRILVSTFGSLAIMAAAAALPPSHSGTTKAQSATQDQSQSVSGKITSVDASSFSLTVASSQLANPQGQGQQQDSPSTMVFKVDDNTTVDGSLKVGANADVTFRQDNSGAYVAINVKVTQ